MLAIQHCKNIYSVHYRLKELSRALYSLTVLAFTQEAVSVTIPAGKVTDISGNENLASNELQVKQCMNNFHSTICHACLFLVSCSQPVFSYYSETNESSLCNVMHVYMYSQLIIFM